LAQNQPIISRSGIIAQHFDTIEPSEQKILFWIFAAPLDTLGFVITVTSNGLSLYRNLDPRSLERTRQLNFNLNDPPLLA
jgi:hypothetical protein